MDGDTRRGPAPAATTTRDTRLVIACLTCASVLACTLLLQSTPSTHLSSTGHTLRSVGQLPGVQFYPRVAALDTSFVPPLVEESVHNTLSGSSLQHRLRTLRGARPGLSWGMGGGGRSPPWGGATQGAGRRGEKQGNGEEKEEEEEEEDEDEEDELDNDEDEEGNDDEDNDDEDNDDEDNDDEDNDDEEGDKRGKAKGKNKAKGMPKPSEVKGRVQSTVPDALASALGKRANTAPAPSFRGAQPTTTTNRNNNSPRPGFGKAAGRPGSRPPAPSFRGA